MKISVMIIAHNEERKIRKCLKSLSTQTRKPDEIVLIAHNCTDQTEIIAKDFPNVKTISYKGPAGIIPARIKGFEEATGEILLCTDGDSFVMKNWVESMVSPFEKNPNIVGVGSPVIYYGLWIKVISDIVFLCTSFLFTKILGIKTRYRTTQYFWGPSMAVRRDAYKKIGGLNNFLEIKDRLGLKMTPEDNYLAILLSKIGKIHITYKTMVFARVKVKNLKEFFKVEKNHHLDGNIMFKELLKD